MWIKFKMALLFLLLACLVIGVIFLINAALQFFQLRIL
jgi:hypothetical protein